MDMVNCKEEFLEEIAERKVLCASISLYESYVTEHKVFNLPIGYSEEQFNEFCEALDFEYDAGYGGQELFGFIWYLDGRWSERGEYDGSEWWNYKSSPPIPESLSLMKDEQ